MSDVKTLFHQLLLVKYQDLNKANSFDTEAPFMGLNLSITNGIVSTSIYDKRGECNFEIHSSKFPIPCSSPILWCLYFAANSFCESLF